MKKKIFKNGYTLIELLAVMIVLIVIGTIISSILTSVLRAGSKSLATETVGRNGDFAITQMSKMITYAKKFEGVSQDNTTFTTDCTGNSQIQYKYLKIKSFDLGETTFACGDSQWSNAPYSYANPTLASESASSTTPTILVDPTMDASCYFNCSQENLSSPIKIDIFLDIKAKAQTVFSEDQAEVPFETSIIIRNDVNP